MHTLTQECTNILKQLHEYYQRALFLGDQLSDATPEELQDIFDERYRILSLSGPMLQKLNLMQHEFTAQAVPAQEAGFLREQKARLRDYAVKFQEQQHRVSIRLKQRMVVVRQQLACHNSQMIAVKSYLAAPQAKPFI